MSVPPADEGTALPIWERWTVDEILDDVVRLAVCSARDPRRIEPLIGSMRDAAGVAPTSAETEQAVRDAVMAEELRALVRWTDEVAWHVPLDALATFLARREGKPGLPGVRPVREGDVFWVVIGPETAPGVPGIEERTTQVAEALADPFAPLAAAGADVWDVTAAARQVVKVRTVRALERQRGGTRGG